MSPHFWVETVYFVRLSHLPKLLQRGQEGSRRRTDQPSSEQRPPIFCPLCCWYWQTDGAMWGYVSLPLVDVWYWNLVCNAGVELVDAESHTLRDSGQSLCLVIYISDYLSVLPFIPQLYLCFCVFCVHSSHVSSWPCGRQWVCKSWPGTGPWHSLSSCLSKSTAAVLKMSKFEKDLFSVFSVTCKVDFKKGNDEKVKKKKVKLELQLPADLALLNILKFCAVFQEWGIIKLNLSSDPFKS